MATDYRFTHIDGLWVPWEEDRSDPDRPAVVYWPHGYETPNAAAEAIRLTEAGQPTPDGVPVDTVTGRHPRPNPKANHAGA